MSRTFRLIAVSLTVLALAACKSKEPDEQPAAEEKTAAQKAPLEKEGGAKKAAEEKPGPVELDDATLKLFAPLEPVMASTDNPVTPEKVDLGRMLYYDARFSAAQDISCNTCHDLAQYGIDPREKPTSMGHKEQVGDRNSPTVYNAAGHTAQFWDGREPSVEAQAKGPVLNPVEMAMPGEALVLEVLNSMPEYVEAFKKAFPDEEDPVSFDNFAKAIGAFERKLTTPSRFDAFLKGKKDALTAAEKKGLQTFVNSGCTTCHNGQYLGGRMFQKVGLIKPWPNLEDTGRFKVTGNEADKFVFKVPSLRNIEKTAPYFHDGSVADLGKAVQMMAEHQVGRTLSDEQVGEIVTFLKALTGELPTDYIAKPDLPKSTDKTPKPQGT